MWSSTNWTHLAIIIVIIVVILIIIVIIIKVVVIIILLVWSDHSSDEGEHIFLFKLWQNCLRSNNMASGQDKDGKRKEVTFLHLIISLSNPFMLGLNRNALVKIGHSKWNVKDLEFFSLDIDLNYPWTTWWKAWARVQSCKWNRVLPLWRSALVGFDNPDDSWFRFSEV